MKIKDLVRPDFPNVEMSFWRGFGSLFDFHGRGRSRDFVFNAESDARALERDWQRIGNDMQKAFDKAGCR